MTSSQQQIDRDVRIHDKVALDYEKNHDEVFNPVEQDRLRASLARACEALRTASERPRALDFGYGSGNLTRHLLALGFEVVAADVSPTFLELIERRHAGQRVATYPLDGVGPDGLADGSFDLAATYSVLHHVPDYLGTVGEMSRVVRPGGIVYIDHAHSPSYWSGDPVYREFVRRASRLDWRRVLVPHNCKLRRRPIDPKYSNEGGFHVWPDDHIDWDAIAAVMVENAFQPLFEEVYLVCPSGYCLEIYENFCSRCANMRVAAWRKGG